MMPDKGRVITGTVDSIYCRPAAFVAARPNASFFHVSIVKKNKCCREDEFLPKLVRE